MFSLHVFCYRYLFVMSLPHTFSSEMPVTFLASAAANCLLTALSDSVSQPLMFFLPPVLWFRPFSGPVFSRQFCPNPTWKAVIFPHRLLECSVDWHLCSQEIHLCYSWKWKAGWGVAKPFHSGVRWGLDWVLLLPSCITLGLVFHLSETQLTHLSKRDGKASPLSELWSNQRRLWV